jgi:sugar phosphate isomerase/epimerase
MAYKIGVSSGFWKIERPAELLGLAQKIAGWGATAGVGFVQADLETTSEFYEPGLKEQLKRIKSEFGLEAALHAEVGEVMCPESAEKRLWDQFHLRLIETVKHATEMGMSYVNLHLSERPQLMFMEAQYRLQGYYYPVVSFDGRPLHTLEDSVKAKRIAQESVKRIAGIGMIERERRDLWLQFEERMRQIARARINAAMEELKKTESYIAAPEYEKRIMEADKQREVMNEFEREQREKLIPEFFYEAWKQCDIAQYVVDMGEITAYQMVAAWMEEKNDPLWTAICGGDPNAAYISKHDKFNAAVAAKYLEGHLTVKDNEFNKKYMGGMSVLEWCNKNKIYLAFETELAGEGYEGKLRLFRPQDAYHLIKKLKSPYIKLCLDFEHMLSHKLKPEEVIDELPDGSAVAVIHLGRPIPYFGMAHVPIPLGSRDQEYIYRWLWALRKKGFKDGWFVFERGGGKTPLEVMQQSVIVMRLLKEYLEKDVPPDELPEAFYGIAEQNEARYKLQLAAIREHAWDPLAGLITIPEETHTFFGRAAVERGKAEEWKKGRFR